MARTSLPLTPIDLDLESKLESTVSLKEQLSETIGGWVNEGIRNVFFVGAGASIMNSYAAHYLLYRTLDIPVFQVQSDELNHGRPAALGKGSLVIVASYTGRTKETVAAAKFARESGAYVLAVGEAHSPLAEVGMLSIEGIVDVAELLSAYVLCEALGVDTIDYETVYATFREMPKSFPTTVEEMEPHVHDIAVALQDEPIIFVLGSGPNYGWAYGLAMCYLQEMQWMQAISFNSGEFFQGAFEMVTEDTAVLNILGEDPSRPLAERAQRFLDKFTRKGHTIDVKDFSLPGIVPEMRGMVSPLILSRVVKRVAQHLESVRGHNWDQRRYMGRIEY